jgi:hypothetical protein
VLKVGLRLVPTKVNAAMAATRDQCGDQGVFDRRDTRFIVEEISKKGS